MKMNWRNFILTSTCSIAAILIPVLLLHGHRTHGLNAHLLLKLAIGCAAVLPAAAGKQLMARAPNPRATQGIGIVLLVLLLPLVMKSVRGGSADLLFFLIVAGAAAMLPLALYLNRRRVESGPAH